MWRKLTRMLIIGSIFLLPAFTVAAGEPDAQPGEVTIFVDGQAARASEGMVVAQGVKGADGLCNLGMVQIQGHVSRSLPSGSVTVGTDEDCRLIVKDIHFSSTSQQPPAPPKDGDIAYAAPKAASQGEAQTSASDLQLLLDVVYFRGWAQATYEEQFNIDVSKVYTSMDYTDDGSIVVSGRNPVAWCWWRSGTGWGNDYCGPYDWYPYGTSSVWITNQGHFYHSVGPDHWLSAKYQGWAGYSGDWWCNQWGEDWPAWDLTCSGGMTVIGP